MKTPALNWVVALKPEAAPLIDSLDLKQVSERSRGGFPVFQNSSGNRRLVISGIGKVNAAAATAWLGQFSDRWDGWINFGIAGSRTAEIGAILRAGRVTDGATGRSWYPVAVWPKKEDRFDIAEVLTADRPTMEYPEGRETIEMEAAGFYPTALRFSSAELVHAIKVISDNEETGFSDLKPARVREIAEGAVPEVLLWSQSLESICREEFIRLSKPEGWEGTVGKFRFSETEKHQLKRLTERAVTLGKFNSLEDWCGSGQMATGKEILKGLDALLSDAESTED